MDSITHAMLLTRAHYTTIIVLMNMTRTQKRIVRNAIRRLNNWQLQNTIKGQNRFFKRLAFNIKRHTAILF